MEQPSKQTEANKQKQTKDGNNKIKSTQIILKHDQLQGDLLKIEQLRKI